MALIIPASDLHRLKHSYVQQLMLRWLIKYIKNYTWYIALTIELRLQI